MISVVIWPRLATPDDTHSSRKNAETAPTKRRSTYRGRARRRCSQSSVARSTSVTPALNHVISSSQRFSQTTWSAFCIRTSASGTTCAVAQILPVSTTVQFLARLPHSNITLSSVIRVSYGYDVEPGALTHWLTHPSIHPSRSPGRTVVYGLWPSARQHRRYHCFTAFIDLLVVDDRWTMKKWRLIAGKTRCRRSKIHLS